MPLYCLMCRISKLQKSILDMEYKLDVQTIFELGKRTNQEDSMSPTHGNADVKDRVFVLCDGMGGHSAGEVASGIVAETLRGSVLARWTDGEFSDEIFKQALSDAYDALDKADDGAVKKMGTTMTFLCLHQGGATIAHIGDSRVYHIRPAASENDTAILFQTSDHSLVNDLVKIGEMTPEEAKVSKQKNVITRAMQPNMERRSSAEIHHISDVKPGDYFFMCTDGILENMEDDNISYIFSDEGGDIRNKVDIIVEATSENRDNHSAFLIHVVDTELNMPVCQGGKPQHTAIRFWIILFVAVLTLLAIFLLVSKCSGTEWHVPDILKSN